MKTENEVITCDCCGEVFIVPQGDNKYYNCFEISKPVSHQNIDTLTEADYDFPDMITIINLEGRRNIFKCNNADMLGTDTEKEGHAIAAVNKNYCKNCAKDIVPKYVEVIKNLNDLFDEFDETD